MRLVAFLRTALTAILLAAACIAGTSAAAQVTLAPVSPVIGSSNPVTAEPSIQTPNTASCTVELFTNLEFADFNTKNFSYAPPAGCPGPWAKVVFSADFSVTAGVQYDRTTQLYLGGATLFFGTTPEPRSNLAPAWHLESDVTDLTPLLKTAQAGTALLGNYVGNYGGVDYDGIIYGDARLTFYQADAANPAPATPNLVIGMPGNNGAAALNTPASVYTQTVSLPTNVVRAYLDVVSQGQSQDEFWYLNVPNDLTGELENYGGTSFRETEISIDGTPAGVAPIYPWIFTGGIDPFLWEPIPGIQTLNFKPFRVDLTPFAGLLSDGNPHTVTLQVFNASSYFQVSANLLLYTDPVLSKVTGHMISNTLASRPTVNVANNLTTTSQGAYGNLVVSSARSFSIKGQVETSAGYQTTEVDQNMSFENTQYYTIDNSTYKEDVDQYTTTVAETYTSLAGKTTLDYASYIYPLTVDYSFLSNPDGTYSQITKVVQEDKDSLIFQPSAYSDEQKQSIDESVSTQDTLHYDANFNFLGNSGTASQASYVSTGNTGSCYSGALSSANLVLTSATFSTTCPK